MNKEKAHALHLIHYNVQWAAGVILNFQFI